MNKEEFEGRTLRLLEIGKVIDKLPVGMQGEAFQYLKGYVSPEAISHAGDNDIPAELDGNDDESLFVKFDHDRPSDNVRLIVASIFQEYGSEPFSAEEVGATASAAGITVPERIDMTLGNAVEKGKKLFVRTGRGTFKPTVHGEAYLKVTYGVKKGTKKRSSGTD
jgi:hypothetical protein